MVETSAIKVTDMETLLSIKRAMLIIKTVEATSKVAVPFFMLIFVLADSFTDAIFAVVELAETEAGYRTSAVSLTDAIITNVVVLTSTVVAFAALFTFKIITRTTADYDDVAELLASLETYTLTDAMGNATSRVEASDCFV